MRWLLLRGFTREQRHWGEFPDIMAESLGEQVVCIDAPGFGTEAERRSPYSIQAITDDVRARFAEIRGDDEWSVLGISLGGMLTLDWCARYPEDFVRSVVVNSAAANVSRPWDRFSVPALKQLVGSRFLSPEDAERAVLNISSNRKDLDFDSLSETFAEWNAERHPSRASIAGQAIAAASFRAAPKLNVPLLVLSSRGDRLVSYRCSEGLAERFDAPLQLHDTAGHDLALDDPDWICQQIIEWRARATQQ